MRWEKLLPVCKHIVAKLIFFLHFFVLSVTSFHHRLSRLLRPVNHATGHTHKHKISLPMMQKSVKPGTVQERSKKLCFQRVIERTNVW